MKTALNIATIDQLAAHYREHGDPEIGQTVDFDGLLGIVHRYLKVYEDGLIVEVGGNKLFDHLARPVHEMGRLIVSEQTVILIIGTNAAGQPDFTKLRFVNEGECWRRTAE